MRRAAEAAVAVAVLAGLLAMTPVRAHAASDVVPPAVSGVVLPADLGASVASLAPVSGLCDHDLISTLCSLASPVISLPATILGGAAGYVAGAAELSFTGWLADAAAALLGDVLQAASTSLQPDLSPGSFLTQRLQPMLALAGGVAVLFLLLAVGQSLVRADPSIVVSTLVVRLPAAFGVTAVLLFVTGLAVAAVDQMTAAVIGGDMQQSAVATMQHLATAFQVADSGGTSLALVALCALGTIVAGILLYAELAVRTAVIYLVLLFLPLGLAASVWPSAGRMARRLADILVVAVLAKFVILVALWFSAGLLDRSSTGSVHDFGGFVTGLVILFLAAGSPLVLLGLVTHAEHGVAAVGAVGAAAAAPPRFAMRQASMATRAGMAASAGPAAAIAAGGRPRASAIGQAGRSASAGGAGPTSPRGADGAGGRPR